MLTRLCLLLVILCPAALGVYLNLSGVEVVETQFSTTTQNANKDLLVYYGFSMSIVALIAAAVAAWPWQKSPFSMYIATVVACSAIAGAIGAGSAGAGTLGPVLLLAFTYASRSRKEAKLWESAGRLTG